MVEATSNFDGISTLAVDLVGTLIRKPTPHFYRAASEFLSHPDAQVSVDLFRRIFRRRYWEHLLTLRITRRPTAKPDTPANVHHTAPSGTRSTWSFLFFRSAILASWFCCMRCSISSNTISTTASPPYMRASSRKVRQIFLSVPDGILMPYFSTVAIAPR